MKVAGSRLLPLLISVLWLTSISLGFGALLSYKARPGRTETTPASQPVTDAAQSRPALAHLRMFLHPHCPCSKASLSELGNLLASANGLLDVEILVATPLEETASWKETPMSQLASRLPHVRVSCDTDGIVARQFGAETSGHVVVYDARDQLVFSGGLTRARGHEGISPGSRSLLTFLQTAATTVSTTPVFGCPLFAAEDCPSQENCCRKTRTTSQVPAEKESL